MNPAAAYLLSLLSGFVALSYELLWYRVFSFASKGVAPTFPLLLGAYLLGIAIGSRLSLRYCHAGDGLRWGPLAVIVLASNAVSYLAVPGILRGVQIFDNWTSLLPVVALATAGMGAAYPMVAHAAFPADEKAGSRVARMTVANIAGSAAGCLITGFLLMDRMGLEAISVILGSLGLLNAALVPVLFSVPNRLRVVAALAFLLVPMLLTRRALFDAPYERLFFKSAYSPDTRFEQLIENRSGVISVLEGGVTYGGGIYDGAINTDPHNKVNTLVRAYALAAFHPAPKEILLVGLSTGAWASVMANHPSVERLTGVDINPGYLELIRRYPQVSPLLSDPRVEIVIDDGRRWLLRNPERKFDVIVANVFHWRSGASNLLSREFLEIIRSRLKPGGVYYFNTTGSAPGMRTALEVFPQALLIHQWLAVSESPLTFKRDRWRRTMLDYRVWGRSVFDSSKSDDLSALDKFMSEIHIDVPGRDALLKMLGSGPLITDDNMGEEWTYKLHP